MACASSAPVEPLREPRQPLPAAYPRAGKVHDRVLGCNRNRPGRAGLAGRGELRSSPLMAWKSSVLVVANQTADSPELIQTLRERAGEGEAEFTLLLPRLPGRPEEAATRLEG